MTDSDFRVYAFIVDYFETNGYPPTIGEICVGLNTRSRGYVRERLERLDDAGYIKWDNRKHRAMKIMHVAQGH